MYSGATRVTGQFLAAALLAALCTCAWAGSTPGLPPPGEDAADAFPAQKHFSPYAGRHFPTRVFWGDTHLHTSM